MDNSDYDKLVFRKQFLMTAKKIEGLLGWKRYNVCFGQKMLYVHPDLEVTVEEEQGKRVMLLGYMLDWKRPQQGNGDIIRRMLAQSNSFMDFVESTYDIGGRFALMYEDENECNMFHDAGGQREVYYHIGEHGVSCAAQLPILASFLDVAENTDIGIQELYHSDIFLDFKKQWVGEDTIYKATKSLKPNHYISMETGAVKRYWPLKPLERVGIEYAVDTASEMLKGFLKAAALRGELLIPVTAGWDSRILLAASREICDKVMYYVIKFPHMEYSHMDIEIPRKLLGKLGVEFHVIEAPEHVDERFAEIFRANTAYFKEDNLAGIYNVFFKKFPEKVNVSSHVSEVIRSYRGNTKKYRDEFYSTCVAYGGRDEYYNNEYVKRTSGKWIENNMGFSQDMNVDPFSLFCWEEWLGWEASQRSETDIAIEEYTPFSCRSLMAILLSVRPSYRNKYSCSLYKRLMEKMWPQVLSEPINPSFKRNIKGMLVALDMLYPTRKAFRRMKR
ncbi:hypothetical protein SAMN02745945_01491 [Peptoclostridium litorale DSM 5388]|uniref:Asparagine synthetase domain-containing protein n=1 Tax=Peptoclostridium litorale DSM 5388 TaxID=1121324 RepID=A0A069RHN7_PEPLI|nr:hypothetical protein [Peptoclostridium litorale]KDR95640.1 hypothetical protein CLIT_10c03670 [Peptoclostridium litorale DSM 5388]SIO00022.1 hypothetical protein SAMN02745945_01491 [Peptoclostridium litorale DSM 5388]